MLDRSSKRISFKRLLRDMGLIIGLFTVTVYIVYYTSFTISKIYFIALLLVFLASKKDYFWFAYFFVVAQGPGFLFSDFSGSSLYRLPLYQFVAGMSFTPLDIFVILAVAKAILKGRKVQMRLGKPLIVLLIYATVSVLLSSFMYGTSADLVSWHLRWVFCYSIIISFMFLVTEERQMYHFISLIFPFVFFITFTQIYFLATGGEFINNFSPEFRGIALNTVTGELRPVMGGVLIIFFSYIFSIFLLLDDCRGIPKTYLYLVSVVSFFSVFLSATRIWFIIFSIVLVGYIIISKKKVFSIMALAAICLCVISLLNFSGLVSLKYLASSSWGRFGQLFGVAGEGVYAIDTAWSRAASISIVLHAIKQNPVIGYGFSELTWRYYTMDLGFLNTIVVFGLGGFLLLVYFFVRCFSTLINSIKKASISNPYRVLLKMILLMWVGMLVGYFLTWDFFTLFFYKVYFVSIMIVITEFFVKRASGSVVIGKETNA